MDRRDFLQGATAGAIVAAIKPITHHLDQSPRGTIDVEIRHSVTYPVDDAEQKIHLIGEEIRSGRETYIVVKDFGSDYNISELKFYRSYGVVPKDVIYG